MKYIPHTQAGFSKLLIAFIFCLVLSVGFYGYSHFQAGKATPNKIEQELSSIKLPAGVSLQSKDCGLGDAVDQASGNCTFIYSTTSLAVDFNAVKQAMQNEGMTGEVTSGVFYFAGGKLDLTGQLSSYPDTKQLKIFAELGDNN